MRPIGITELHLHLEGSLSIESAIAIAAMREHPWGKLTPKQLRLRFRYASLNDFLGCIREMCQVLSALDALERASFELSLFLAKHGARYAEVYASPYIYVRWGHDYCDVLRAIDRGFARGEAAGGARCTILLDSVRQWGPEAAMIVLEGCEAAGVTRVVGFGMGGEEIVPLETFLPAYEKARRLGLKTLVHAGEEAGVTDVWKAVDVLGVDRIAHGIRAVNDPALMRVLRDRAIPLDLAITSNYKTAAVRGPHPVRQLVDAGIIVTLSTDDPSLFRTNLVREYQRARRFGGIHREELWAIAANGIACSFASPEEKAMLHEELKRRRASAS